MARDKAHLVAMTGSYFRGDAVAVLHLEDEARFETVTYTYYEQLNGYRHLKQLDIGYYFYSGSYTEEILTVLDPAEKTIVHIPNVNSRESTKDKIVKGFLRIIGILFNSYGIGGNRRLHCLQRRGRRRDGKSIIERSGRGFLSCIGNRHPIRTRAGF
jgi:hypothetical protein